ncbi:uncharacterized protein LOC144620220 isoform X2 [Crassostrea virginica]
MAEYYSSNSTCVSSSGNISASGDQPARREGTINNNINETDIHSKRIGSKMTEVHRECRDIKAIVTAQNRNLNRIKRLEIHRHKRPSQRSRLQKIPTLPGSAQDECFHGEVLREHVTIFAQNVTVSNTLLLDEMLQKGVITDSEKEQIMNGKINENKARKIIAIVSRNDKKKFQDFLDILSKDEHFPYIGKSMKKSYEEKLKAENIHVKCIRCFIVKNVSIKQILDHLYEKGFIDLNKFERLLEEDEGDINQFWEESFQKMASTFKEFYFKIFTEALRNHYPHIVKRIQNASDLKCLCSDSTPCLSSNEEDTSLSLKPTLEQPRSVSTEIIPDTQTSDPFHLLLPFTEQQFIFSANVDEIGLRMMYIPVSSRPKGRGG